MYNKLIQVAAGCSPEEAADVEEIMRHDIFHSTLDWVPKEQFDEAAKKAYFMLRMQRHQNN